MQFRFSSCFISKCEEWRNKTLREGEYNDIFDGQVWKDFLYYDGIPTTFPTFENVTDIVPFIVP